MTSNQTVQTPNQLHLVCEAIGNPLPIVSWTRHNRIMMSSLIANFHHQITPNQSSEYFIDKNGQITNNNSTSELTGIVTFNQPFTVSIELFYRLNEHKLYDEIFSCLARNAIGSAKQTTLVEIISPPIFKDTVIAEIPLKYEIFNGFSHVLSCDAIGKPIPEITWQKVWI